MTIQDTLKHLDELEAKATKGPWKLVMLRDFSEKEQNEVAVIEAAQEEAVKQNPYTEHVMSSVQYYPQRVREDDMEFLTLLRNAYPALISAAEECERLREAVAEAEQRTWLNALAMVTDPNLYPQCCENRDCHVSDLADVLKHAIHAKLSSLTKK